MRKYVLLEIKSHKSSLKNFLNFFWFFSRDVIVFLFCFAIAVLMFLS